MNFWNYFIELYNFTGLLTVSGMSSPFSLLQIAGIITIAVAIPNGLLTVAIVVATALLWSSNQIAEYFGAASTN